MIKTQEDWVSEYKKKDAFWIHDGNPRRPHALLSSGIHSNGFFNSQLVITDKEILRDAASDLLEMFAHQGGDFIEIKVVVGPVVGPQTEATKLAMFLRDRINEVFGPCFSASPAKSEKNGKKSMVFGNEELGLLPGQSAVLCEDVLTTGGNIELTASAVTRARGIVLPWVLALVNRSGLKKVNGKKIVALIDHPIPTWAPEECPLCKMGSDAIRPKGMDNWARLCLSY